MADETLPPPTKLMNFVSEEQLNEAKRTRGARVEDGTAQRDRPLYEVLKENKDKKDAEFNERFKHRPPKALDEDETEFLDKLEMTKREYERQLADDEAQQLRSFQAAVAAQSTVVHEVKEKSPDSKVQKPNLAGKKNPPPRPSGMIIKVMPQLKRSKISLNSEQSLSVIKQSHSEAEEAVVSEGIAKSDTEGLQCLDKKPNLETGFQLIAGSGLVSYSDESEDDD